MNKKPSRISVKKDEKETKQYADDPDYAKAEVALSLRRSVWSSFIPIGKILTRSWFPAKPSTSTPTRK